MEIGNRIQELRKKKNISQEELSNVMNVSRQAVSKWESNLSAPDIEKIIDLCEYFDVSADYLLRGKEISKKLESSWVEFYPILSLVIKFLLMIVLYFLGAFIGGVFGVVVYIVFAALVYLLEKKLIETYSLDNNTIYYDLGVIFYSFPFIHILKTVVFQLFIKLLEVSQELALTLHRRNLHKSAFAVMYRSIKNFHESIYTSTWFPTVYLILIYVIVNYLMIRYIRKKRKQMNNA